MDALQGSTLEETFRHPDAEGPGLQAAQIADALLRGVDRCHQQQVLILGLCPSAVWVCSPMSGSRVSILDWSSAERFVVESAELSTFCEERRKGGPKGHPVFVRCDTYQEVPWTDLLPLHHVRSLLASKAQAARGSQKSSNSLGVQPLVSRTVSVQGHCSLHYASLEQLHKLILSFEDANLAPPAAQSWGKDRLGAAAIVDDLTVHWHEKGDGYAQTGVPVT
ncbi:unnamed protein product, partial [Polarella glacialis]